MKKTSLIVLIILILVTTPTSHAYTPITYVFGSPQLSGAPTGVTPTFNNFMSQKKGSLAPSLQCDSFIFIGSDNHISHENVGTINNFIQVSYHQKLDALAKGLYFQIHAPLTTVTNKEFNLNQATVINFTLLLGYQLFNTSKFHLTLNGLLTLNPSSENASLFFGQIGNISDYAPGFSIEGGTKVWEHKKHTIDFESEFHYHHAPGRNKVLYNNGNLFNVYKNVDLFDVLTKFSYKNVFWADERFFFVDLGPSYHFKTHNQFFSSSINSLDKKPSHLLKLNTDLGIANKEWKDPFFKSNYALYISLGSSWTLARHNDFDVWNINIKTGSIF